MAEAGIGVVAQTLERGEGDRVADEGLHDPRGQLRVAQAAQRALSATCDHIGASLEPGATVHLTHEQRDELTGSLATLIESGHALIVDDVASLGASNGVLHGAQTWDQLEPFITEAYKSVPE